SAEGTEPWEVDYPDDEAPNGVVNNTFAGDGGPSVGNWWNRALYAARFGAEQILFSDRVTDVSQILYYRDPIERVGKVAPFLPTEGATDRAVWARREPARAKSCRSWRPPPPPLVTPTRRTRNRSPPSPARRPTAAKWSAPCRSTSTPSATRSRPW